LKDQASMRIRRRDTANAARGHSVVRELPQLVRKKTQPDSPGARLFAVLEAIAESDDPVGAVDLVGRVGVPRATVYRLCVGLERLGYLERELGSKRFVIGQRQLDLSINSLMHSSHRAARHSVLQALAREVGETVNVTVLDGNEVVYIDRVECQWPLRTHLQLGSRVSLHCGASGKLFLSFMPAERRRRLLAGPLLRYTDRTITDRRELEEQLKKIRAARYSIDDEEFMQGLIGIAVPVYDARKRLCATVSLHAPTARLKADRVMNHVPAMQRCAEAISKMMAGSAR